MLCTTIFQLKFAKRDLLERLHQKGGAQLSLHSTFEGLGLAERIGMFLATLELVRMRKVTVLQDENSDEIMILLLQDEEATDELNSEEH